MDGRRLTWTLEEVSLPPSILEEDEGRLSNCWLMEKPGFAPSSCDPGVKWGGGIGHLNAQLDRQPPGVVDWIISLDNSSTLRNVTECSMCVEHNNFMHEQSMMSRMPQSTKYEVNQYLEA